MENETVKHGTNLVVGIMLATIFIAVFLIAVTIIINTSNDAASSVTGDLYNYSSVTNETTTNVNNSGVQLKAYTNTSAVCTVTRVINGTQNTTIAAGNYTVTGCLLKFASSGADLGYNNTDWRVTYNYRWVITSTSGYTAAATGIKTGIIGMLINFFELMPVVGTILAVIILIAAIVILVLYIRRMSKSDNPEVSGGFVG